MEHHGASRGASRSPARFEGALFAVALGSQRLGSSTAPFAAFVAGARQVAPAAAAAAGRLQAACALRPAAAPQSSVGAAGQAGQAVGWAAALAAGALGWSSRRVGVARQGMKDRIKKDFTMKSAMIRKLGKLVLQKEFDMRTQILEDPKLAQRSGITQEELLADFNRAATFIQTELGCEALAADIVISKVATGLYMQHLGRPSIPTDKEMTTVFEWLLANLNVKIEDGSLGQVVEQYPFILGRSIEELDESKRFCPEDINYEIAVAEDPALVDKTYNCDGICANQCVACWYNG